jgi:hypothetical protein
VRVWLASVLGIPAFGGAALALTLTSPAFAPGETIPTVHTCEGADKSPPLAWSDAPAGTKSFALVVDDPDAPDPAAPKQTWVHWVVYDLPAKTSSLAAGAALPRGARTGRNDYGHDRWNGPCPPVGRHRYFHKLYALDVVLGNLGPLTKAGLEQAMTGHVLQEADLVGTYQKQKAK